MISVNKNNYCSYQTNKIKFKIFLSSCIMFICCIKENEVLT